MDITKLTQVQLDALKASTNSKAAQTPIATISRGKWYQGSSNGTDVDMTFRSVHEVLCDSSGIQLLYGNFFNDGRFTGLSPLKINVSVDINGTTYPLYWEDGETERTLPLGSYAYTRTLWVPLKVKTRIYVRTHVVVPAGGKFPTGLTIMGGMNAGEGLMEGDATTGTFTSISPNPYFAYTPMALYGIPNQGSNFKTVGLCGDSISIGAGSTNRSIDGRPAGEMGFLQIGAMRAGWGYVSIGMNGQRAADFAATTKRINQLEMVKNCDLVIVEYGTNDLNAGRTLAQIKEDLLTIHRTYRDMGIDTVQTTIAPRTTSTDGWSTLENQSPSHANTAGGPSSVRSELNDWIRTNPEGIVHLEIADVWESGRNTGLWSVVPEKVTGDGVHPNNYGHEIAAGIIQKYLVGSR